MALGRMERCMPPIDPRRRRSSLVSGAQDRALPVPFPRSRGHLSATVREPHVGPVGVRPGVRQRVGAGRLRQASHQVRRVPEQPVPGRHRRRDSRTLAGRGRTRQAVCDGCLSHAARRDLPLLWWSTSTGRHGAPMPWRISTRASRVTFPQPWNARAPGMAVMSGYSSTEPCQRAWPGAWGPCCSPPPWMSGPISDSARTTGSSRARTHCRAGVSET